MGNCCNWPKRSAKKEPCIHNIILKFQTDVYNIVSDQRLSLTVLKNGCSTVDTAGDYKCAGCFILHNNHSLLNNRLVSFYIYTQARKHQFKPIYYIAVFKEFVAMQDIFCFSDSISDYLV